MDKKEFVQRYIIAHPDESMEIILHKWNEIENAFSATPTTNLWDYNDMKR